MFTERKTCLLLAPLVLLLSTGRLAHSVSGAHFLRTSAATTTTSVDVTTITFSRSGQAHASQTGVLRVQRDFFRNGGWGWRWKRPNQYGDGYSYGNAELQFRLGDLIPPGSTITSAEIIWNFTNLLGETDTMHRPKRVCDSLGNCFGTTEYGGDNAKVPKEHGSETYCGSGCSPATINRVEGEKAFWASYVQLNGA
jgi:hypothetical protein